MASGKGTSTVGDVASLGRIAGDAQALGDQAKRATERVAERVKAGAALFVVGRDLLGALTLVGTGFLVYGGYSLLAVRWGAPAAALIAGGLLLGAVAGVAAYASRKLQARGESPSP